MFLFNRYYDKNFGKIQSACLLKDGVLYTGRTHNECFRKRPLGELRDAEQGFITENGVFVDRKQALKIAKHYKQIKVKHLPKDILFSEDLMDLR